MNQLRFNKRCCPVIKIARGEARVEKGSENLWIFAELLDMKWFSGVPQLLAELWLELNWLDFWPLTNPDKVLLDNYVIQT